MLEETRTDEDTEEYTFDILDKVETITREVSTELLDISRCVLPEITEVTRPTSDSISWKIEEGIGQSVESLGEVINEVTTVRFDVGQLMKWPDRNSDGVMICEFKLESEMFSHGPAQREAEPVFESEMFTQVFSGGSLLSRTPWLWQRQLHREFLFCRWLEANSRPVCLRPLAEKTGGV